MARSVRALILHSGNLFGGVETALAALARTCRVRQTDLTLSFALCYDDRRLGDELREMGYGTHRLGAARLSRPWRVMRARGRLDQLLASSQFDLCVTTSSWVHAIFAPVVLTHGLPLVVWAHDRWTSSRWLDRVALRHRPSLVVANSRYTAEGMSAALRDVPSRVVHCGVSTAQPYQRSRSQIRAELATTDDAVVIVQVSRLDRTKGHEVLIDALGRLPRHLVWRCWIVGGADTPIQRRYLTDLKELAVNRHVGDRVTFTGARRDVPAVLRAADIFCHPNIAPESCGIAFVEALQAGLPVVGTAGGGVLEIVTHDCGRLVSPGDRTALATVLAELIASPNLRSQLGVSGPERATRLCDPDTTAVEFAEALATVVPDHGMTAHSDGVRTASVTRQC
jgi:glycosyltransferase involved in cell wall biosynthesis